MAVASQGHPARGALVGVENSKYRLDTNLSRWYSITEGQTGRFEGSCRNAGPFFCPEICRRDWCAPPHCTTARAVGTAPPALLRAIIAKYQFSEVEGPALYAPRLHPLRVQVAPGCTCAPGCSLAYPPPLRPRGAGAQHCARGGSASAPEMFAKSDFSEISSRCSLKCDHI